VYVADVDGCDGGVGEVDDGVGDVEEVDFFYDGVVESCDEGIGLDENIRV
jgi:hypothetical protein